MLVSRHGRAALLLAALSSIGTAGCVNTSAPVFTSAWDSQGGLPLPVSLVASGTGDRVNISWTQLAPIQPPPAKWRLLTGPCGASLTAMTAVAEGAWPAPGNAGNSTDSNLPLGQCRAYRLVGVAADGAHATVPTAEFAFTPARCSTGWLACAGLCANANSDAAHCGASCAVCATTVGMGATCQSGICKCPGAQSACGGACIDTSADAAHCGPSCAICATGATCLASVCQCPAGTAVACGGRCVDQTSDTTACGASCAVCATAVGTGATCQTGICQCPGSAPAVVGGNCVDRAWANWPLPAEPPTGYVTGTGSASGTVTDTVTGLVWQHPPAASSFTWDGAKSYCAGLNLGGPAAGAWRLPTVIELFSLVDDTRYSPSISPTAFPNTPTGVYRSSLPSVAYAGHAWVVDFVSGNVDGSNYSTNATYLVRCVH